MTDSDELLEKSTEDIVSGLDGEPAADVTLNTKVAVGSVASAERADQLADIATDREPSFKLQRDWERRLLQVLEALVQLSWLGVAPMIAIVVWYHNWTPVYGLIAGTVWAAVSAIALINIVATEGRVDGVAAQKPARLSTLGHVIVFVPALTMFAASFFVWVPSMTDRYWVVRPFLGGQSRVYGPGEWLAAPPFISTIRGVSQDQDRAFKLAFTTTDRVPMVCQVIAHQRLTARADNLREFVAANPDPDRYLREITGEPLEKLARRIVGEMSFGDLSRRAGRFAVEGTNRPMVVWPGAATSRASEIEADRESDAAYKPEPILELKSLEFSDFVAPANREWQKKGLIRMIMPKTLSLRGTDARSVGDSQAATPSAAIDDTIKKRPLRLPPQPSSP